MLTLARFEDTKGISKSLQSKKAPTISWAKDKNTCQVSQNSTQKAKTLRWGERRCP
jgi:hypothetical protein